MNKTLKYALSAVLGLAIITPSLAQQFPDVVPPEHWAYDAVLRLKEAGLLVGYPDGKYRGPRNATRYEMAVAIHATYDFLKKMADAHDARIKALEDMPRTGVSQADFDALKAAVAALQSDMDMIKRWRSEIDELNRLAKAFERDIAGLGVDVAAMKKDITDLMDRVGILEKRKAAVDIHGDINWVSAGGYSDDPEWGIGVDGHRFGQGDGAYGGNNVGMDKDFSVWYDAAFVLSGTNESGPKWGMTVAITNMFEGHTGNQNELDTFGGDFDDIDEMTFFLSDAWVSFPTSVGGVGFDATVGRFGHSISPYIFMRPDNSPYYVNERWDNGKWAGDGAMVGFNFGQAKLNVFLTRVGEDHMQTSNDVGMSFQTMMAGQSGIAFSPGGDRPRGFNSGGLFDIDRVLGAQLNVPLGQNGALNLAYLWLASNDIVTIGADDANGVNVLGGDIRFNLGGPTFEAGYSQSNVMYNSSNVVDEDNASWYARLGWNQGRWGANVGYRMIEPQFAAPGWWGRIGIWWNPVDIQGFMADAHFDLTDMIRLTASGEWYNGTETTIGGVMGLSNDDELRSYKIGLAYKINGAWDFGLGYERVEWSLEDRPGVGFVGGSPTETWWNIGFGYTLANNVGLKLLWQISDYDSKGVAGFSPFGGPETRARGGVATAQLSIKY